MKTNGTQMLRAPMRTYQARAPRGPRFPGNAPEPDYSSSIATIGLAFLGRMAAVRAATAAGN